MSDRVLRDDAHCVISIAPLPWTLGEGETWTNEVRRDQIRRLEAAYRLECQAVRELERALVAARAAGSPRLPA
jgi:hypothetical protein